MLAHNVMKLTQSQGKQLIERTRKGDLHVLKPLRQTTKAPESVGRYLLGGMLQEAVMVAAVATLYAWLFFLAYVTFKF